MSAKDAGRPEPPISFRCAHCGKRAARRAADVRRSRRIGMKLFCGRRCSGLERRLWKPKAQLVEEKRLYDEDYRRRNRKALKVKKHAYHKATYDPIKAATERKKKMPRHVEYCRQPWYKKWKSAYDRRHRARKEYGPAAEAAMLLRDLETEIQRRMTRYEIQRQNQTGGKSQARAREEGRERDRRRDPASAHGQ